MPPPPASRPAAPEPARVEPASLRPIVLALAVLALFSRFTAAVGDADTWLMWDAWPLQKTFVDGRALNESVFRDYMKIAYSDRDAQSLLDQYGVQVLLLEGFEYWTGKVYTLGAVLSDPTQTKWKLVFQDTAAMIFMREPPPGVQPLDPGEVFNSLDAQCAEHLRHEPGKPGCIAGLGNLYIRLGKTDRVAKWRAYYDQISNGTFHASSPR